MILIDIIFSFIFLFVGTSYTYWGRGNRMDNDTVKLDYLYWSNSFSPWFITDKEIKKGNFRSE